jgi:small subunit ribosomal protein S9
MPTKSATPMTYYTGVGRRKSAVAQIRIQPGNGSFTLNGEKVPAKEQWQKPLQLIGQLENTDVSIVVRGGGFSSQSDAITLGIARAIVTMDDTLKPTLRKAGLVTVDARVKERKKPGLKRSSKAPHWSKR